MVNESIPTGSEIENKLAEAIRNNKVPKDEVLQLIKDLPAVEPFVKKNTWLNISRNESLEKWRRWEAYKLLINRCISYPCNLDDFIREAITPLGVTKDQLVDMTMAQSLPVDVMDEEIIFMVNLPISTPVGPASVYLAVSSSTNSVKRVGVHPVRF